MGNTASVYKLKLFILIRKGVARMQKSVIQFCIALDEKDMTMSRQCVKIKSANVLEVFPLLIKREKQFFGNFNKISAVF